MKTVYTLFLFLIFAACSTKNTSDKSIASSEKEEIKTVMLQKSLKAKSQNLAKEASQNDNFKEVDFSELNKEIAGIEKALTPKEIMKIYYPAEVEGEEGNQLITLKERTLDDGNVEVVLIHDNQLDDSVQGHKYHMELTKKEDKWTVVSLKNNWKCWEGRGHTDWSVEYCL